MLLVNNKRIRQLCGALETFNYLTLKLWIKRPAQAIRFSGQIFRSYMSLVGRDKWVSRCIEEIIPELAESRVVIDHLPGDGVYTPVEELAYLAILAKNIRPLNVFEFGTFRGRTALNFALNSSPECTIYTLDLPLDVRGSAQQRTNPADAVLIQKSDTGLFFRGRPEAGRIRQLYGDSLSFDFTPYHGKIDLVFIDGAHDYRTARSDTLNALKMITDRGFIVWHDFANYGDYNDVTRAVLDLLPPSEIIQIDKTQLAVYRNSTRSGRPDGVAAAPGG